MFGPTRQEVLRMKLDQLRPLVQRALAIDDWPGDWEVAGSILENGYFNFQRANTGEQLFGITLFGQRANGTGIDEDPLVAIFKAYILLFMEESELRRRV